MPGPYTLQQLADDTLDVLADANVESYVLVGHSMGGKVSQLIAARRPPGLRGVVLVASAPAKPAARVTPEYRQGLAHAYDSEESVAGARDQILTATALTDEVEAQIVADSRSCSPAARAEWPPTGIATDITEQTGKISVPTLLIGGEHDAVEPVTVLRDNLVPYLLEPDLVVIPETGHLMPLEAPDAVSATIAAFADAH